MENTASTMQMVLQRTINAIPSGGVHDARSVELKLIQSLDDIRNPQQSISAEAL